MRRGHMLVAGAAVAVAVAALAPSAVADDVKPGAKAPNVVLKLSDGTEAKLHDIGNPVVLFFYPKDFTGG